MASSVRIDWNDGEVLDGVLDFAALALTKTVADAAADAQQIAPVDTGNLVNKIGFSEAERTGTGLSAEFRSGAEYSMAVNDGRILPNGEWREGEHFMEQAWDRNVPLLKETFRQRGFDVE